MRHSYSEYWWVYMVRGIFAILFGAAALLSPVPVFATLIIFLGAFMILDGIFSVLVSINNNGSMKNRRWMLWLGITGIIVGSLTFFNPLIAAVALVSLFAFWSFVAGIIDMMGAITFRRHITGEGWYILSGILSIVAAILLLLNPMAGVFTLAVIFGVYAVGIGISLVILSIGLKKKMVSEKKKRHFNRMVAVK